MKDCIEVHNLKKRYGTHIAVNGISFRVKQQEIFAFLGPNGAGKSTTISILSTLQTFDEGEVRIEGFRLGKENHAIHTCLGIVFQESTLDVSLSVKKNLLLRCGLYSMTKKESQIRVTKILEECKLKSLANQKVKHLSGGQRRRVDIARALLSSPKLLILDEPSTGLDPASRRELWDLITQLHKQNHMTIFMTTHYLEESEIADHIVIVDKGNIILDKYRKELIEDYEQEVVDLYTDTKRNVMNILQQKKIQYECHEDRISVTIHSFYEMMAVLRASEIYLRRVEIRKGNLEDLYLRLLGEHR